MRILKRIKYNFIKITLLKTTSLVVIGAFLFTNLALGYPDQNLRPVATEEKGRTPIQTGIELEKRVGDLIKNLGNQDELVRAAAAKELGGMPAFQTQPLSHIGQMNRVAAALVMCVQEDRDDLVATTAASSVGSLLVLGQGKLDGMIERNFIETLRNQEVCLAVKKSALKTEKEIRKSNRPTPVLQHTAVRMARHLLYFEPNLDLECELLIVEVLGGFAGQSSSGINGVDYDICALLVEIAKQEICRGPSELIFAPQIRLEAIFQTIKVCEQTIGAFRGRAGEIDLVKHVLHTTIECLLFVLHKRKDLQFTGMPVARSKAIEGLHAISNALSKILLTQPRFQGRYELTEIMEKCEEYALAAARIDEDQVVLPTNGYRTPARLAKVVDKLIGELSKSDASESAAAAEELGSLREFKIGLAVLLRDKPELGQYREQAVRAGWALKGRLMQAMDESGELALVGKNCARAIGDLGSVWSLGDSVDIAMAQALARHRTDYDLEIRREIISSLGRMRFLSPKILDVAVAANLNNELTRTDGYNIEIQYLTVKALGNIGKIAYGVNIGDVKYIFNVLSTRYENNDKCSPDVRREAIEAAVDLFVSGAEELAKQFNDRGTTKVHKSPFFVKQLNAMHIALCGALPDILDRRSGKTYAKEEDVRLTAAKKLKETLECWGDLLSEYPEELGGWEDTARSMQRDVSADIREFLCGENAGDLERSPAIQAVLLDVMSGFGNVKIIDSMDLRPFVAVSDDEAVNMVAVSVIIRRGNARAYSELMRLAGSSERIKGIIDSIFSDFPELERPQTPEIKKGDDCMSSILRPMAMSEMRRWYDPAGPDEAAEAFWKDEQVIEHIRIFDNATAENSEIRDASNAAWALHAIASLAEKAAEGYGEGVRFTLPLDIFVLFASKFTAASLPEKLIIIRPLMRFCYVEGVREILYGILQDTAAIANQTEDEERDAEFALCYEALQAAAIFNLAQIIPYELPKSWYEIRKFSELLYRLTENNVSPEITTASCYILCSLIVCLDKCREKSTGQRAQACIELKSEIGRLWKERLTRLSRHKGFRMRTWANDCLKLLGFNDDWELSKNDEEGFRKGIIRERKKQKLQGRLTRKGAERLARSIQMKGLSTTDLLAYYFEKRKVRALFVCHRLPDPDIWYNYFPAVFPMTFKDAAALHQRGCITYFALPIPPELQEDFEKFLDGEDSPEFLRILQAAMQWESLGRIKGDVFQEIKTIFRKQVVELKKQGLEILLFGARADSKGSRVFNETATNLGMFLAENQNAKVFVYSHLPHALSDLHFTNNMTDYSIAQALSRYGFRLASVIEDTQYHWKKAHELDRMHNLDAILKKPEFHRSFGVRLRRGTTIGDFIGNLRFDNRYMETYTGAPEGVFDGLVLRYVNDGERDFLRDVFSFPDAIGPMTDKPAPVRGPRDRDWSPEKSPTGVCSMLSAAARWTRFEETQVLRPVAMADRVPEIPLPQPLVQPSDEFIDSILTDQAREAGISNVSRERIRQIISYFWRHEGWASRWDLISAAQCSNTTFLKEFKQIDLDKLKNESRVYKKSIPLYFQYSQQKDRLIRIIGIIESLGWRVSVREIGECLGISAYSRGTIRAVLTNCKNRRELASFMTDVNYNRHLAKKMPIEVLFTNKAIQIKKTQDMLINALEAFDGRATASDLAKILEIRPDSVWKIWKKIEKNLDALNKRRRAQGLIPIIGVVPETTKRVQDEIIEALEYFGGVATMPQLIARAGQSRGSTDGAIRELEKRMTLINEIRIKRGLFPLFIIPRSKQEYLRRVFMNRPGIHSNTEAVEIAKSMSAWHRKKFGRLGIKDFENRTVPFAYMVVYRNGNNTFGNHKDVTGQERLNNIFQRVLEVIIRHAEEKGLYEAPRVQRGSVSENQELIAYYRIAVTRALNVSRGLLANVDVPKFNPFALNARGSGSNGQNGSRRGSSAIRPEEEEHIKAFLANVDKALEQFSPKGTRISFRQGSVVFNRLRRLDAANTKYEAICQRERRRFEIVKSGIFISSETDQQPLISGISDQALRGWEELNPASPIDPKDLPDFKRFVFRKGTMYGARWNWPADYLGEPGIAIADVNSGVDFFQYEDTSGAIRCIPAGTPVRAILPGKVFLGSHPSTFLDQVCVRINDGKAFTCAHIIASVQDGYEVKQGDIIGTVTGKDPFSAAPRLHVSVFDGDFDLSDDAVLKAFGDYKTERDKVYQWFVRLTDEIYVKERYVAKVLVQKYTFNPMELWPELKETSKIEMDKTIVAPVKKVSQSVLSKSLDEKSRTEKSEAFPKRTLYRDISACI